MNMPGRKILTITEIVNGDISVSGKQNSLNLLLNQPPPESWIKTHPIAKSVKYLPIDKVEYLLTSIFIEWFVEVKNIDVIANSAVVTVRLSYLNPVTDKINYQDGAGAAPIHTASGAGAMDWNKVQSDSVMKAVPAAESYAIKDAAEKIGKIFGKDLNRKDTLIYDKLADPSRFEGAKLTEK